MRGRVQKLSWKHHNFRSFDHILRGAQNRENDRKNLIFGAIKNPTRQFSCAWNSSSMNLCSNLGNTACFMVKFVCGEVLRSVRKCIFQKFFGNFYLTNAAVFFSFEHRFIKLEFHAEENCGNGFVIALKIMVVHEHQGPRWQLKSLLDSCLQFIKHAIFITDSVQQTRPPLCGDDDNHVGGGCVMPIKVRFWSI